MVLIDGEDDHRIYSMKLLVDHIPLFVVHDIEHEKFRKMTLKLFKYCFFYWPPRKQAASAIASNTIRVDRIDWGIKWKTDFYRWRGVK